MGACDGFRVLCLAALSIVFIFRKTGWLGGVLRPARFTLQHVLRECRVFVFEEV